MGGGQVQARSYSVNMTLGALQDASPVLIVNAYVVPRITAYVAPSVRVNESEVLKKLTVADSDLASNRPIEALIGAELNAQIFDENSIESARIGR